MSNSLQNHISNLKKICRLCSGKIKLDGKYATAKTVYNYLNEIKTIFDYDCDGEDNSIYPNLICSSCRRKLDRCKSKPGIYKLNTIPTYNQHTPGPECNICSGKRETEGFSVLFIKEISIEVISFELIKTKAKELKKFVLVEENNEFLVISKIKFQLGCPSISLAVNIDKDFNWQLFVYGKEISKLSNYIKEIDEKITASNIDILFKKLSEASICVGNQDCDEIVLKKTDDGSALTFYDKSQNPKAFVEDDSFVKAIESFNIRTSTCEILLPLANERCENCTKYRQQLTVKSKRVSKSNDELVSINTNNKYLTKQQLILKAECLAKEKKELTRKLNVMQNRLQKVIKHESMKIQDEETNSLLKCN